jgi:hypothetical protein
MISGASAVIKDVVLQRGAGRKAELNGRRAQVGTPARGGWTTATVAPIEGVTAECLGGYHVKWRTNHWDVIDDTWASHFVNLADELLCNIFDSLWLRDFYALLCTCKTLAPLARLAARLYFAHPRLSSGLPRGFGVAEHKQLRFIAMLGTARPPLHSLQIELGTRELDALRWLLQEGDVCALTELRVDLSWGQSHMSTSQMPTRFDLTQQCNADLTQQCNALALPAELAAFAAGVSPEVKLTLTGAISQLCPSLASLVLVKQVQDVPSLASIKTLRSLEANFLEVRAVAHLLRASLTAGAFRQVDDINFVLSSLPLLTHLYIAGGTQSPLAGEMLDLESPVLEVFDLSRAGKGLFLRQVNCPALRELRCRPLDLFSNGISVIDPLGRLSPTAAPGISVKRLDLEYSPEEFEELLRTAPGKLVFGTLHGALTDHIDLQPIEIDVHPTCTVSWELDEEVEFGLRSAEANLSTTYEELLVKFGHYYRAMPPDYERVQRVDLSDAVGTWEERQVRVG